RHHFCRVFGTDTNGLAMLGSEKLEGEPMRRNRPHAGNEMNARVGGGNGKSQRGRRRDPTPLLNQQASEIQQFGSVIRMPIALDENVREQSARALNAILADTITVRDLYKKHHWQVSGHTFYQLHLLFDKHAGEQEEL